MQRTLIRPPSSRVGPATPDERAAAIAKSPAAGRYDHPVDRHSAYEQLAARATDAARTATVGTPERLPQGRSRAPRRPEGLVDVLAKSAARSVGSKIGREIVRGLLGSLFRGR